LAGIAKNKAVDGLLLTRKKDLMKGKNPPLLSTAETTRDRLQMTITCARIIEYTIAPRADRISITVDDEPKKTSAVLKTTKRKEKTAAFAVRMSMELQSVVLNRQP